MTIHLGNVDANSTLYIPFASYDSNGASVTLTGLAVTDIEIYKNGSVTQRSSDAGYTLLDTDGIDFDGITGIHGFSIDLADNTDAGFYAAGSFYWVVVSAVTIDSQTVNFIAATFRIGPQAANVTQFGGSNGTFSSGRPEVNTTHAAGTAWGSGAITAASIATGAIDADALAADAGTEIGTAVWASGTRTLTAGTNIDGSTFTTIPWNAAWDAEVQSEVADALVAYDPPTNTEMEARTLVAADYATATNLATVDTVVDAIKEKTDSLTFTVAGSVDSNIQYVNDEEVTGDGQSGTEWGPA